MYTNPVLDADFPDPSALRGRDGWWYAYSSQHTTRRRWAYVPLARSADLVSWELVGDALPVRPAWSLRQWECAWAPHVVERAGAYFMFYSAMPDSRSGMCIGVATASQPAGPFVDSGAPVVCAPGYEAIDPMAFQDPISGRWFLYWGGDYKPISVAELAPDLLRLAPDASPQVVLLPDPGSLYERVVEGPFVAFRDGWYYLFYSGDDFGGDPPSYAVLVARSRSPLGPFEKRGAALPGATSAILERNDLWDAPGHASITSDAAGQDWLVYHAVDPGNRWQPDVRFVRRPMLMDPLVYEDGWPAAYHSGPSRTPRRAPIAR